MSKSYTAYSKKYLEKQGYTCWIAERWNAFAGKKQDAWNMFDILCVKSEANGVLGVQVTSRSNTSAREKKLKENPILEIWLSAGNRVQVHGWDKLKNRYRIKDEEMF